MKLMITGEVIQYLPYMLTGLVWTFSLVFGGLSLGFLVGLPLSVLEVYMNGVCRVIAKAYSWFFRGVPLIVLLFLFHWGILPVLGLKLPALATSIIVLGLRSGAYQSQLFRGAFNSIDNGQITAALALGMSRVGAIIYIIIPQALRKTLPALSNEYAIILKDSAVCFVLGILEMLNRTRYVVIATGDALTPYFFAGITYALLTLLGTRVINIVYTRVRTPGLIT